MDKPIKILFLAANPIDTSPLKLEEEIRAIDEALVKAKFRERFEIVQHWAVRVSDLQSFLLRHNPDIVHFSGHGSPKSQIILKNTHGWSHPVSMRGLSRLFSVLKDNVRCVVLNSCYSEDQAQAIAEHVECVIGMSKAIGDSAAISFSSAFYQALGFGKDVKTAFELGCIQIDLDNLDEQDTPKLFARNTGTLKFITEEKEREIYDRLDDAHKSVIEQILDKEKGEVFLKETLPKIIGDEFSTGGALTVALLDIDDLTLINKHYGHEVGDKVLAKIASIVSRGVKSKHHIGRCGDDTFFIIFYYLGVNKAEHEFYTIRRKILGCKWSKIAAKLKVTCSIGFVRKNFSEDFIDTVIRAAVGLTEAKRRGKNTIEVGPQYIPINQSRDLRDYFS